MLDTILLTATGMWLGAMVFFAAVVAPTVFGTLEPVEAGRMIRRVFPKYYLFGLVCITVALLASLTRPNWWTAAFALLLGITAYARQILMPRINTARDAMLEKHEEHSPAFTRLHKLSVQLNALEMLVCAVLMYAMAS